ncbi:MAG TPA: putative lipid II flippase FtsW [Actinobacteria bacterium]|nr:putative lipid II flippase FtsW [Actinomycetota bacterium]
MEKQIKRHRVFSIGLEYYFIFIITLVLSIVGIVMISSASISVGERYFNDSYWFIRRQVIWWFISFVFFLIASKIDYKKYRRFSNFIILIIIGLLALVLIPGFSIESGGSRRWLDLWFFSAQPSEFAKLALIIFFSDHINRNYMKDKRIKRIILPSFLVLCLVTVLIFLEPDLSTVIVIWLIVFMILYISNVKLKHILSLGLIGAIGTTGYMFLEDYRRDRLLAFFNGTNGGGTANFQVDQSLIALGSGNIIGLGLGNSVQKYSYLPEAQTDFIFAIIGEELGLIGTMLIVLLFLLFAFFGIRVCLRTADNYGRALAAGCTGMIVIPAIINISVVTGLLPVTGLTLPFISFGGSSLLHNMIGAGILLNISRQNLLIRRIKKDINNKIKSDG